jgi:ligand-binding SRPBCC domain-containing protein
LNDEITWEAVHFGIKQRLSVRIVEMNRPYSFTDMMLKGTFKSMRHEQTYEEKTVLP